MYVYAILFHDNTKKYVKWIDKDRKKNKKEIT